MHIAYYLPWSFNWALVVLLYRREIYSKSHSTNLQSLCYCSQKNSEHHWKCQSKELWKASLHKSNENTSQKKKSKSTFFLKMLEINQRLAAILEMIIWEKKPHHQPRILYLTKIILQKWKRNKFLDKDWENLFPVDMSCMKI